MDRFSHLHLRRHSVARWKLSDPLVNAQCRRRLPFHVCWVPSTDSKYDSRVPTRRIQFLKHDANQGAKTAQRTTSSNSACDDPRVNIDSLCRQSECYCSQTPDQFTILPHASGKYHPDNVPAVRLRSNSECHDPWVNGAEIEEVGHNSHEPVVFAAPRMASAQQRP